LGAAAYRPPNTPAVVKHAVKHWTVIIEVVLDQASLVLGEVLVVKIYLQQQKK
jgi:hypothetical protein